MDIQHINNRELLEEYFRQDLPLHLYSLGDLDDFYWPRCKYYGTLDQDRIRNVCLLYQGAGLPVFLALGEFDPGYLERLTAQLPSKFYAHLSPNLERTFLGEYLVQDHGSHLKMILEDFSQLKKHSSVNVFSITKEDLVAVQELYADSYPDNAFDPRMLDTGFYYGCIDQGKLISIAGIHVYSHAYRVAALGNIATHPGFRNQGFCRMVTVRLCKELVEKVTAIGLNVKSDNLAAIALYQDLGFRISNEYGEFSLQKRV